MRGWGIGPRIAASCFGYGLVAVLLTRRFPEVFGFPRSACAVLGMSGALLVSAGFVFYLATVGWFLAAKKRGALVTTGPFGVVRHPLYATWLWLILPGIALLCHSWPMLGVVPVGYIAFKAFIKHEEDGLERMFGREYETYRWEVNQIFPSIAILILPKRRKKERD